VEDKLGDLLATVKAHAQQDIDHRQAEEQRRQQSRSDWETAMRSARRRGGSRLAGRVQPHR
jgi:hypothetical protein